MYATGAWGEDDVQIAAERIGIHMNVAEAENFLRRNEERFLNRIIECGNEVLEEMLEHERYLQMSAKWRTENEHQ